MLCMKPEQGSTYINLPVVKLEGFFTIWYHTLVSVSEKWEVVLWLVVDELLFMQVMRDHMQKLLVIVEQYIWEQVWWKCVNWNVYHHL
jgi:hypothetical protein